MKNIRKAISHLRRAGDFKLNKLADEADGELNQLIIERDSWKREAEIGREELAERRKNFEIVVDRLIKEELKNRQLMESVE